MKQTVFLNSILYANLYNNHCEVNGDRLIAVYSILKAVKRGRDKIPAKKNKNYALLHKSTKLSIKTLKKYIPVLIKMGLCAFSNSGDFVMLGSNKIHRKYKTKNKQKFVGITIDTFTKTTLNAFKVRVYSMEQAQKNRIDKSFLQKNIMSRVESNKYLTPQESKIYKALAKKGITLSSFNNYCEEVVLSVCGFGLLKSGVRDRLYLGAYWKNKLISAGIIKSTRRTAKIRKCSKAEFEKLKTQNFSIHLSLFKGWLYREEVSSFSTI